MKKRFSVLAAFVFLVSCSNPSSVEKPKVEPGFSQLPSQSEIESIRSKYPGAVPYQQGIDSVLKHLSSLGITSNSILWGQSICVDDITNTKNKLDAEIKGPFNIGGLAGLPFTGVTGLVAFSHHIPEDGTAVVFVAPHIGFNEKLGWGKLLRHEQHEPSSCCGALVAALTKLQKGELKAEVPSEDDYQEGIIEQTALAHRDEILSSADPLIALTNLTYHEAIRRMSHYASKLKERHFKYVVVIGGIIINTDYKYTDFLSVENIAIRDVQKNEWVEGIEKLKPDVTDSANKTTSPKLGH